MPVRTSEGNWYRLEVCVTLQGECTAWEVAKTLGFFVDETSLGKYFRAAEPLALTLAMFRVGGRSRRKLVGNKPGIEMLSCKGTVRRWSVAVMYTTESSRTCIPPCCCQDWLQRCVAEGDVAEHLT